jgi:hypothetical protein
MLCDGRSKELTAKDAKKDVLHAFLRVLRGIFALFAVMIFLTLQIILPIRGV